MQSLHNYSSLVWPFGIEIRITAAQGLLTKPLTHTSFEKIKNLKKRKTQKWSVFPRVYVLDFSYYFSIVWCIMDYFRAGVPLQSHKTS